MARLNVNPTRMVLSSLKKRLQTAVRGHKLMKDKRDNLIKKFLALAKENKVLRDSVEKKMQTVHNKFSMASAVMSRSMLEESIMFPKLGVNVSVSYENITSVDVPVFDFNYKDASEHDIYPYGFANTSGELDGAIKSVSELFPIMLQLAAIEKKTYLIAQEIEKTRRRVNALEHIIIPQLQETIRFIRMKLDENERGNQIRLMKVKDMILKAAILERQAATEKALSASRKTE